jgi:hypothetical protein
MLFGCISFQANAADDSPLVFDNLAPEELNLTIWCIFDECDWDQDIFTGRGGADGGGGYGVVDFGLFVTPEFDAQARPWVRMVSFEPNNQGFSDLNPDPEFSYLPELVRQVIEDEIPGYPYAVPGLIPSTYLSGYVYTDYNPCALSWCMFTIDNVQLEFISDNIEIDFDPWSDTNVIRPKWEYFITVQVNTTSVANGDAVDFDAATINPAEVRLGPNSASLAAAVLTGDLDGDGDLDYIFGFRMEDTGISCLDTSLMFAARTFSGDPVAGHDSITPIDCVDTIDIDVDPWNASNEVRPDDAYLLTVGVLGMNTADGDPIDLDAAQVDPDSLKFGPTEAPNAVLSPISGDVDGDGNQDMVFGFRVEDSGIACGDTELEMTGSLYSGIPIEGTDSITTTDCTVSACHP